MIEMQQVADMSVHDDNLEYDVASYCFDNAEEDTYSLVHVVHVGTGLHNDLH